MTDQPSTGTPSGDEIRARVAEVRRRLRPYEQAQRDARIRAGRAKPRTAREWAIFAADLHPDAQKGQT